MGVRIKTCPPGVSHEMFKVLLRSEIDSGVTSWIWFHQQVKAGSEGNSQISDSIHKCIWWDCSQDLGKLKGSLLKDIYISTGGIYACASL